MEVDIVFEIIVQIDIALRLLLQHNIIFSYFIYFLIF